MTEQRSILPVSRPVCGEIRPPGSKSLTNRALITAALAEGTSRLNGLLDSVDTRVMIESLGRLGIEVQHDSSNATADIVGCGGRVTANSVDLYLENSGTSIRFLTAVCTLGQGTFRLDGNQRMRERPIVALVDALNELGADVVCEANNGCPPVRIVADGLSGGTSTVAGDISSQYLSALLMAAPAADGSVVLEVSGQLVSEPYIAMTLDVMRAFGVNVESNNAHRFLIEPQAYRATTYDIEPDASAASYFFAVAAITGGTVTVTGLSRDALQGDVAFVEMLEQMGCTVESSTSGLTVTGGPLRGVDVDMNAISDTAQTLAVVAAFAEGPTRIRNVAHIRHKETDRIEATVTELRRMGLEADTHDDGLTIHPAMPHGACIETYDDHRMAMSFAIAGLRVPGILIADPDCTSKTYPHFFDDLQMLCDQAT